MSDERGIIKVVGGKYKPSGKFHFIHKPTPIRDENGKFLGITNPRDLIHIHSYGGEAPFFEGLGQGKLLGTRCDNPDCPAHGSVFVPFKIHCSDCLEKCSIVDVTDIARNGAMVHTFMTTERTGAFNTLPKPIRFVNVEFEGVCTILMGYLAVGTPEMGMQVVPIFNTGNPSYTILDLAFVPAGTVADDLPDGFTFG